MRRRGILAASVDLVVPFHDVDSMQIVWHGHYAKYLELARCELLDRLGYPYDAMKASGFKWPIIDLQVRYLQPAAYGQQITVRAELIEWEHRLVLDYEITDTQSGVRLTRATTSQVAVSVDTGEMRLVSPQILLDLVQKVMT